MHFCLCEKYILAKETCEEGSTAAKHQMFLFEGMNGWLARLVQALDEFHMVHALKYMCATKSEQYFL